MGFFDKIVNNVQSFANDVQKNVEKTWNDATEQVTRVTSDIVDKGPIEAYKANVIEPVVKAAEPVVSPIVDNPVVDFVKKNNVISMVTNPDDSVVVKTVKDGWDGITKGAEDVFNNIGGGLSKAWPYIAIGGGALLVLSILK